jgi:subtilisin family serine protease
MKTRTQSHRIFKYGVLSIVLILLILPAGGSLGTAAPIGDAPIIDVVPVDEDMMVIGDDLLSVAAAADSKNPKLDSSLSQFTSASVRSVEETAALAESLGLRMSGNLLQVHIETSAADLDAAVQAVEALGGEMTGTTLDESVIQAWLPFDSLESILAYDSVYYVRSPMYAELMGDLQVGASDTEAMAAMNVAAWHTAGIKGAGVKVAVIDGGFTGYAALLGTDLPATVTPKNFVDGEADPGDVGTDSIHGTACAEIVHDIAPEAELYLIKIGTNIDLQEAVTYAIAQGVDIISTSLGWYNLTPGDGTGQFENMVDQARTAGILWLTAASNDREEHWGGLYSDTDTDGYQNFDSTWNINYFGPGGGLVYLFNSGGLIRVFMRWNDWTNVDQDYDLYLVRNIWNGSTWSGWSFVAQSMNSQTGGVGQWPTEYISYTTTVSSAAYGFMIRRFNSTKNVNFEVFTPKVAALNWMVYPRSLSNLADASSALTVAALDADSPYPQEDYSSEGPTNGPGGALTGGFTKPDLSGFANVSTESYGPETFNGTSSATPHVSGAAALVLCAHPSYSPEDIQDYLEDHAKDMGAVGMDTIYGYGRVWLGSPTGEDEYNSYLPFVR